MSTTTVKPVLKHPTRVAIKVSAISLAFLACWPAAQAAVVTIPSAADTTLHEFHRTNNFGGHTHVAAGAIGSPKPNSSIPFATRGLFKFDFAAAIPKGAKITSATLVLKVTLSPGGGANSTFELRRALQPWGEGRQTGNSGKPATDSEANWESRFFPTTAWTTPGGDFSTNVSATVPVAGIGTYRFESNASLVADVQSWLDQPDTNSGWLLKSQSEDVFQTARRFGSREDTANAPALIVEYSQAPDEFRITDVTVAQGNVTISWTGGKAPFQLQTAASLNNPAWVNAGELLNTNRAIARIGGSMEYFRVIDQQPVVVAAATAEYEAAFEAVWSPATHPKDYPVGAHWSGLVGATHKTTVSFWAEGEIASDGIKNVAELGSKPRLLQEAAAAIANGTAFNSLSGTGISSGSGTARITFTIHRDFPLVTLVSMIAPSPDWFVGVGGLSLLQNGQWVDRQVVTLFVYDAGTDSGPSYSSPDQATAPRVPIMRTQSFPALVNGTIVPFGTFTFMRKS